MFITNQNAFDSSILLLADLIHERTGLLFENSRIEMLVDKIMPRMSDRGLHSFSDYYYFLKYSEQSEEEWSRLAASLAVNETYFWREYDQVKAVTEEIIPKLQQANPGRPVRIWHAACATGEEPYSMAISLEEANRYAHGPIEIIATDFNPDAIVLARTGVYRLRSFRTIPTDILNRHFHSTGSDRYRLSDSIRARVQFSVLNLLKQDSMARMRNYDIIFCRNVFIYFSDLAIEKAARSFYQALNLQGYLFVAAAESLLRVSIPFELVEVGGAFGYQKQNGGMGE